MIFSKIINNFYYIYSPHILEGQVITPRYYRIHHINKMGLPHSYGYPFITSHRVSLYTTSTSQ